MSLNCSIRMVRRRTLAGLTNQMIQHPKMNQTGFELQNKSFGFMVIFSPIN